MAASNPPYTITSRYGVPTPCHGQQITAEHLHHHYQPYFNNNEEFLFQQLRNQIEYYFYPQNLEKDAFLLAQLNTTEHLGAVPINVICNFPKVRELYAFACYGYAIPLHMSPNVDPEVVRIALRGSHVVTISEDGFWISPKTLNKRSSSPARLDENERLIGTVEHLSSNRKRVAATFTHADTIVSPINSTPSSPSSQASSLGVPTHPLPAKERNVVIIRDIPDCVTAENVIEAFSNAEFKPKSVRPDRGNFWYITFDSEDQAMAALLQTKDKLIEGAPILGRLKSEFAAALQTRDPHPPPIAPLPPSFESSSASLISPGIALVPTMSSTSMIGNSSKPHISRINSYRPSVESLPMRHHQEFAALPQYSYRDHVNQYHQYSFVYQIQQPQPLFNAQQHWNYFQQPSYIPGGGHSKNQRNQNSELRCLQSSSSLPKNVYLTQKPTSLSDDSSKNRRAGSHVSNGHVHSSINSNKNQSMQKRMGGRESGTNGVNKKRKEKFQRAGKSSQGQKRDNEASRKDKTKARKDSQIRNKKNEGKRKFEEKKAAEKELSINLNMIDFPALNSGNHTTKDETQLVRQTDKPVKSGYAQALLKTVHCQTKVDNSASSTTEGKKHQATIPESCFLGKDAAESYDEW